MILCTALAAALATAAPGSTIAVTGQCPAPIVVTGQTWSPPITLDLSQAIVPSVTIVDSHGVNIVGGATGPDTSSVPGLAITRSSDFTVDGFSCDGRVRCIIAGYSSDGVIANTVVTGSLSDGVDIALSRRIIVDRTTCTGASPAPGAHPDCVQLWSRPDAAPTADILVRRTLSIGNMQGVSAFNHVRLGVDDGGFDRITFTDNIVATTMPSAIRIMACRACVATGNRAYALPGALYVANIIVMGTTADNVRGELPTPLPLGASGAVLAAAQ
mgnify:CR=1 FL=1